MYSVVLAFSKIENNGFADSKFYTGQHFDAPYDFNFPFRPLLEFIAECLRQKGVTVEISLPDYMEFEDFIEGEFTVEGREISIYFEHSLCDCSFASDFQEDLMMLVDASQGKVFQHEGYGLDNADLTQSKGRSGFLWWLLSLFLRPIATFLIVVLPPIPNAVAVIEPPVPQIPQIVNQNLGQPLAGPIWFASDR